jgi:hypothetical protein
MTQSEFLQELRCALENSLPESIVQENVEFYKQYISDEVNKGKDEEQVLQMLGDPWILAKTVTEAQDGTDQSTVREKGRGDYSYHSDREMGYEGYENDNRGSEIHSPVHAAVLDKWWKKLLLILGIIMIIIAVFSIITGIVSLLAPILVPIIIILILVRILANRRG